MMKTRTFIGPFAFGLSAWCAAGTVTVAAPDSPSWRLVTLAPLWLLAAFLVVGWVVNAWRRNPWLAAPALLSTVPFWPLPVAPVLLIWTGPLAWAPVLAALALAAAESGEVGTVAAAFVRWSGRAGAAAAGVVTLVAALATAWSISPQVPGGDEPHYLIITQSLLQDGDLRIENNHRQRDYRAYFDNALPPDYIERGRDLQIYSIHAPGAPVLILPGFAMFGYRGAQLTVLLLAAFAGALVWQIGWLAAARDAGAAWFGWAAVTLTPTALVQGATIFPDAPGAAAVAAGAWLVVRLRGGETAPSLRAIGAVSVALAALPWLHTRFAVLAAGLGLAIAMAIVTSSRAEAARRLVWFSIVPLLSALAWFAFFQVIYGTPDPRAPYGHGTSANPMFVPGGLMGLIFDQQFGLLPYAPALALALSGLAGRVRQQSGRAAAPWLAGIAATYLAVVAMYWMWWAGLPAPPARFATAILPLLAAPIAIAWHRASAPAHTAFAALLAVSMGITGVVLAVDRGALVWNSRDGQAGWLEWIGPVVDLPRGWPSFFWRLNPEQLSTEWSFAIHAGLWLLVFTAIGIGLTRLSATRALGASARRQLAVLWLVSGAMIVAPMGWALNGTMGLDPARSQWALVRHVSRGAPVISVRPLSVSRVQDLSAVLTMAAESPGRADAPLPWLTLTDVPAGTYAFEVSINRPVAGEVVVRLDDAADPMRSWMLRPLSRQSFTLELPQGARSLRIEADAALTAVGGSVRVRPVAIARR